MGRTEALPLTIELTNVSNVAYGTPTTNMKVVAFTLDSY
jgi:hypothetical protein